MGIGAIGPDYQDASLEASTSSQETKTIVEAASEIGGRRFQEDGTIQSISFNSDGTVAILRVQVDEEILVFRVPPEIDGSHLIGAGVVPIDVKFVVVGDERILVWYKL